MKVPPIKELFFELDRLEYPGNPETLQSGLAWSLVDDKHKGKIENNKKLGHIYEKLRKKDYQHITINQTRKDDRENIDQCLAEIQNIVDIPVDIEGKDVIKALLDDLRGMLPDGSAGRAATPVVPGAAFLQDSVGSVAKRGPADIHKVVSQVYRLGGGKAKINPAVTWYAALTHEEGNPDPIKKILDKVTEHMCPLEKENLPPGDKSALKLTDPPEWLKNANTPFKWFAETWDQFCSKDWRNGLPYHRWSDWATCILRTGLGMAFIWEVVFYRNLGKALLGNVSARDNLPAKQPLLAWEQQEVSISAKDQNRKITELISDGLLVKSKIGEILNRFGGSVSQEKIVSWQGENGLLEWLQWAKVELNNDVQEIKECFNQASEGKNTREAIRYCLLCRKSFGESVDYYGLLKKKSRRFIIVEPSPEWIVVVASLAAKLPKGSTDLGGLKEQLNKLGLDPTREILVEELEKAGLTQSSHDADEAILVSGFLGGVIQ